MAANSSLQLGIEMQRISDSITWKTYVEQHPRAKVGFCHHNGVLLLTLIDRHLGHAGVLKYANNAQELLECAADALFRDGHLELL
jgi:hypothetical protein